MNDSTMTSTSFEETMPLAEMSVSQIADLPPTQLYEAHTNLLTLQSVIKGLLDRFHAALEQRYAEQARAARQANGRDFGVCHLNDGALRITVDVPKRIACDQDRLAEIAQRIAASGDKVSDYIDIEYSISESRFNAWPSTLKESFAKASTVKPGKASYRLALINGGEQR